jgi:hypothetical protein
MYEFKNISVLVAEICIIVKYLSMGVLIYLFSIAVYSGIIAVEMHVNSYVVTVWVLFKFFGTTNERLGLSSRTRTAPRIARCHRKNRQAQY